MSLGRQERDKDCKRDDCEFDFFSRDFFSVMVDSRYLLPRYMDIHPTLLYAGSGLCCFPHIAG